MTMTEDYKDRCSLLYYDIVKENAFLTTKIYITKDCYGKVVLNQKQVPAEQKHMNIGHAKQRPLFLWMLCIYIEGRGESSRT
jgi:hypothetical protein